ncbi:hypothetical protein N136_04781, partial [Leifsonia aquatica ATCC 14665]
MLLAVDLALVAGHVPEQRLETLDGRDRADPLVHLAVDQVAALGGADQGAVGVLDDVLGIVGLCITHGSTLVPRVTHASRAERPVGDIEPEGGGIPRLLPPEVPVELRLPAVPVLREGRAVAVERPP